MVGTLYIKVLSTLPGHFLEKKFFNSRTPSLKNREKPRFSAVNLEGGGRRWRSQLPRGPLVYIYFFGKNTIYNQTYQVI